MKYEDLVENQEELQEELQEARQSRTYDFVNGLKNHPMVEKILKVQSMADGTTVFVRTTDGNAYEIDVRPAALAKKHHQIRGREED